MVCALETNPELLGFLFIFEIHPCKSYQHSRKFREVNGVIQCHLSNLCSSVQNGLSPGLYSTD